MPDIDPAQAALLRRASNASVLRWPAVFSLAVVLVAALNLVFSGNDDLSIGPIRLMLSDLLFLFGVLLAATLPVWIIAARRVWHGQQRPGVARQLGWCAGLLVAALILAPELRIEHRRYDTWSDTERRDDTTTWIKRSLVGTMQTPFLKLDELTWLQSNYSAAYIPAGAFCPLFSTRLVPLFGVVRSTYDANALAGGDEPVPPAVLSNTMARCQREGQAMLARGLTKESALMRGDVERFFALNAIESRRYSTASANQIVLEDAAIPKHLLAKMQATLAAAQDPSAYVEDVGYLDEPGRVRRWHPLVLAVALDRAADVARPKGER